MSNKIPLPNLPQSLEPSGSYERRLNVKLAEMFNQIRHEINKDNGWKDMTSVIAGGKIPAANFPTFDAFGPSGARQEYKFAVDDYIMCHAFHVNHDIKIGGAAYPHVHWSSDGTNVQPVRWSVEIMRAIGHQQAAFTAPATITITQTPTGTAWTHMIAEAILADALTLTEPDELLLITLKRVTNGGTENTDKIFGITVDLHYESDRAATPQKAPDFYS